MILNTNSKKKKVEGQGLDNKSMPLSDVISLLKKWRHG